MIPETGSAEPSASSSSKLSAKQIEGVLEYFELENPSELDEDTVVAKVFYGEDGFVAAMKHRHRNSWQKFQDFVREGKVFAAYEAHQEMIKKVPTLTTAMKKAIDEEYGLSAIVVDGDDGDGALDTFRASILDQENFEENKAKYKRMGKSFNKLSDVHLARFMTKEFVDKVVQSHKLAQQTGSGTGASRGQAKRKGRDQEPPSSLNPITGISTITGIIGPNITGTNSGPSNNFSSSSSSGSKRGRPSRGQVSDTLVLKEVTRSNKAVRGQLAAQMNKLITLQQKIYNLSHESPDRVGNGPDSVPVPTINNINEDTDDAEEEAIASNGNSNSVVVESESAPVPEGHADAMMSLDSNISVQEHQLMQVSIEDL